MPVLETDFLLGLRKGDRKHTPSIKIANLRESGRARDLVILGLAFAELAVGLRAKFAKEVIIETIRTIHALTGSIRELGLTSSILLRGLELEEALKISNLYDCLHAASTLEHDSKIVSDDAFYDSIPGLKRIGLEAYIEQFA